MQEKEKVKKNNCMCTVYQARNETSLVPHRHEAKCPHYQDYCANCESLFGKKVFNNNTKSCPYIQLQKSPNTLNTLKSQSGLDNTANNVSSVPKIS